MILHKGKFKIDLFNIKVNIYICEDAEDVTLESNKFLKKHKEKLITFPCHGLVFCPDDDMSTNHLFLSLNGLSVNTITHETDHIRNNIIDYCSIIETDDGRETSANLSGYINEKVFQFLQKKGINIKY